MNRNILISSFFIIIVCTLLLFIVLHKNKLLQEESIIKDRSHENKMIEGKFVKKKEGRFLFLDLPYEIGDDVNFIFDEDTPYAVDIIEMCADGKKLSFIDDIRPLEARNYFNIEKVTKNRKKYFISMSWDFLYSDEVLRWNDGRGLIFSTLGPNESSIGTFSYEISREMKILDITYRIVLPYPQLSIENLYDKNYKNKKYTEVYKMIVDISNIFSGSTTVTVTKFEEERQTQ
jgi:hypothetical protein